MGSTARSTTVDDAVVGAVEECGAKETKIATAAGHAIEPIRRRIIHGRRGLFNGFCGPGEMI